MSKELPSIYKNQPNKKIDNNKTVFYSKYEEAQDHINKENKENMIDLDNAFSFRDALNNLFKNNQFVFNVPVEIITKKETINTKIISKVDNHLLTYNKRVIQLEDILSIKIKDE